MLFFSLTSEAVVGLENTIYSVSENVGVVEVCAIVYSPTIDCPIEIPFDVSLSTSDNTAGIMLVCMHYTSTYVQGWEMFTCIFTESPMDYIGLSRILNFAACNTRQCVNVSIVNNLVDEAVEEFDITLVETSGLDSRITLRPVDARVVIHDDEGMSGL